MPPPGIIVNTARTKAKLIRSKQRQSKTGLPLFLRQVAGNAGTTHTNGDSVDFFESTATNKFYRFTTRAKHVRPLLATRMHNAIEPAICFNAAPGLVGRKRQWFHTIHILAGFAGIDTPDCVRVMIAKYSQPTSNRSLSRFPEEPDRDTVIVVTNEFYHALKRGQRKTLGMSRLLETTGLVLALMCFTGYHIVQFGSLYGQTVTKNEDGYVSSIQGLGIGGTSYNVTFIYNTPFNDLFGPGDPPSGITPSFYDEGAEMAGEAISVALNTQMVSNEGMHDVFLYIPHQPNQASNPAARVSAYTVAYRTDNPVKSHIWSEVVLHNLPRDLPSGPGIGWARFEKTAATAHEPQVLSAPH